MITSGVRREIDELRVELRDVVTRLQAVETAAARFADQLDSLATRGKNEKFLSCDSNIYDLSF